eukprot:gene2216-33776_t
MQCASLRASRTAALAPGRVVVRRQRVLSVRPRVAADEVAAEEPAVATPLKWYERPCLWQDIADVATLHEVVKSGESVDKWTCIELYAGWCSSCKSSFPKICKLPKDKKFSPHFQFYKANIEDKGIAQYIKSAKVTGIPTIVVYKPTGEIVIGLNANFTNFRKVTESLTNFAENKDAGRWVLNPKGIAVPADWPVDADEME